MVGRHPEYDQRLAFRVGRLQVLVSHRKATWPDYSKSLQRVGRARRCIHYLPMQEEVKVPLLLKGIGAEGWLERPPVRTRLP